MGLETILIATLLATTAATAAGAFKSSPKARAPKQLEKVADIGAEADKKKSKSRRASLFETEGGVSGQELNPDQVQKRPTLLGN